MGQRPTKHVVHVSTFEAGCPFCTERAVWTTQALAHVQTHAEILLRAPERDPEDWWWDIIGGDSADTDNDDNQPLTTGKESTDGQPD